MRTLTLPFLIEPSNKLYFDILDYNNTQRAKLTKNSKIIFNWKDKEGEGQGEISFPDGTKVKGKFSDWQLFDGIIEYPSGAILEGSFQKVAGVIIGLIDKGTFKFKTGELVSLNMNGYKVEHAALYYPNGDLCGNLFNKEVVLKNGFNHKKLSFFGIIDCLVNGYGYTQKGIQYSYFGLYYSHFDYNKDSNSPFFTIHPYLSEIDEKFTMDYSELDEYVSYKADGYSSLNFEIKEFFGQFILYTKDLNAPEVCIGFYKQGQYKLKLIMLQINQTLFFIINNGLYNLNELKQYINKSIKIIVECNNSINELLNNENKDHLSQTDKKETQPPETTDKETLETYNVLMKTIENLQRENICYQKQAKQTLDHITAINEKHQINYNKMQSEVAEKNKEINYLNKKLELSEKERRKYSETIKSLQKEISESKKSILQLEATNNQLKALYNNKEKEFFDFLKEFKNREERYKEEKKAQVSSALLLQEQVKKQQDVITALEALHKTLIAENNKLKEETSNTKIQSNQAVKILQDEIECLKIDNERLRTTNLTLSLSNSGLEAEIETLKKKIDQNAIYAQFVENLDIKDYFKGEIVNGKKHGECEEKGQDYYFKGHYNNGLKTGSCILIENGIEQKGKFENDLLQGTGLYKDLSNNKILQGEFKLGQFLSDTFFIGKVKYKGGVKNNKLDGSGYFEFTNGYFFEGRFVNDQIDHNYEGTLIKIDVGEEYEATYENGCIVVKDLGIFEINYNTGTLNKKDK